MSDNSLEQINRATDAANKSKGRRGARRTAVFASLGLGIALVAAGIILLNRIFMRQDAADRFEAFYNSETDYDVLFFGTSHAFEGILPMQLWNDYGISSYVLASPASSLSMSYFNFEEAIKQHKPKVAVLDVYITDMATYGGSYMDKGSAHQYLDFRKADLSKYKAVKEIYEENDEGAIKEMMLPLSIYHSRWTELSKAMIRTGLGMNNEQSDYDKTKGSVNVSSIYKPQYRPKLPERAYDEQYTKDYGSRYIRRFVETCIANDIEPIVIAVPYDAKPEALPWLNTYLKVAEDAGSDTLNLFNEELIDWDTDCNDWSHLNDSGARKITDYIGGYLREHYGIEDKREHLSYASWNEDYDTYREYIDERIKGNDSYGETLLCLNNANFRAELEYTSQYNMDAADEIERKLIAQLGDNIVCRKVPGITDKDGNEADIRLVIYDTVSGERIVTKYYREGVQQSAVA